QREFQNRIAQERTQQRQQQQTGTTTHVVSSPASAPIDVGTPPVNPPPPSGGAAVAVETAREQLGKPYVYAGSGPNGFDCSGLTMFSWAYAGVYMPHSAAMQYDSFPHVAIDQLQPGDLVFYGSPIHHVGIFVGGGTMIEAPHTGAFVRYASI